MFIALHRHRLHSRGVLGESHVRSCHIPLFMCLSSLKTPVYVHDYIYIRTQARGENVSQPELMLLECSLFCSSGPLGLVLHSHQYLLTSQTFHLWAAHRLRPLHSSALIMPHPCHSSALTTTPPSSPPHPCRSSTLTIPNPQHSPTFIMPHPHHRSTPGHCVWGKAAYFGRIRVRQKSSSLYVLYFIFRRFVYGTCLRVLFRQWLSACWESMKT